MAAAVCPIPADPVKGRDGEETGVSDTGGTPGIKLGNMRITREISAGHIMYAVVLVCIGLGGILPYYNGFLDRLARLEQRIAVAENRMDTMDKMFTQLRDDDKSDATNTRSSLERIQQALYELRGQLQKGPK